MVSKIQIESWVLMHACKNKYHHVVKGVLSRHRDNLEELDVPKIYLSIAMIYNIVTTDNVLCYPVVVSHLDFIRSEVPDAVPFKLYSKLSIGLKMKCAMELLKKNHGDTLMVLNNYFPRKGSRYEHVPRKELSCLHSAQKNFRKFFLPLLAHQNQREAYFREEYEEEYGKHYQGALQQLAVMFVEKLTALLPPTVIEKILTEGPERYLPLLEGSAHLSLEMLLDTLHGKETLEEKDLLDLLTMVSPLHTQDRVQVDKVWLLSSEESNKTSSKSLFSSESEEHPTGPECGNRLDDISGSAKTMDVNLTDSNQNHVSDRTCRERTNTASKDHNTKQIRPVRDSFGDFNDRRHLFHCDVKDSQNKQTSEKDSELIKRNSDNVESPKSSGESVSILRKKQMPTKTCTGDARLHEGDEVTGHPPEDLPEQVHTVSSSDPNDSNPQVSLVSGNNAQNNEVQKGSSLTIGSDLICDGKKEAISDPQSVSDVTLSSHQTVMNTWHADQAPCTDDISPPITTYGEKLVEEIYQVQTESVNYIGAVPTFMKRCSESASDIDEISSEEDEMIPPSTMGDVEFWDIFSCGENNPSNTETLAVPAIGAHAKHPDMKLCVVKLFRNDMLDIQRGGPNVKYAVFS